MMLMPIIKRRLPAWQKYGLIDLAAAALAGGTLGGASYIRNRGAIWIDVQADNTPTAEVASGSQGVLIATTVGLSWASATQGLCALWQSVSDSNAASFLLESPADGDVRCRRASSNSYVTNEVTALDVFDPAAPHVFEQEWGSQHIIRVDGVIVAQVTPLNAEWITIGTLRLGWGANAGSELDGIASWKYRSTPLTEQERSQILIEERITP